MKFYPTELSGAWRIELEAAHDNRGFFARTFCSDEFAARGLETRFLQHSISYTARSGSLRGMHYQCEPDSEVKVVRCLRGSIVDVIIDIRPQSPTYGRWAKFELSGENGRQIYIPAGFAHGFQTLRDDILLSYMISAPYKPESGRGIRYDDPAFGIEWPLPVTEISEKDTRWPDFVPVAGPGYAHVSRSQSASAECVANPAPQIARSGVGQPLP